MHLKIKWFKINTNNWDAFECQIRVILQLTRILISVLKKKYFISFLFFSIPTSSSEFNDLREYLLHCYSDHFNSQGAKRCHYSNVWYKLKFEILNIHHWLYRISSRSGVSILIWHIFRLKSSITSYMVYGEAGRCTLYLMYLLEWSHIGPN